MSNARKQKKLSKLFQIITPWDEVLLGNKQRFNRMTEPHLFTLLSAALADIEKEVSLGHLQPDVLQPEELVGETLVQAWYMRHGRSERKPIKDWLLEVQKYTLQKMIQEEKRFFGSIAVSLEAPVRPAHANKTDIGFDEWLERSVRDRWADVIPDENSLPLAA